MSHAIPHPQMATLNRSLAVQDIIKRVFAVTFTHLSNLKGRTIHEFCLNKKNVPRYVEKFFTFEEQKTVETGSPNEFNVKLSLKLLKTCCGLSPPKHAKWASDDMKDSFEYLITYCWNEYNILLEGSSMTDDNLNAHMDSVLGALFMLIEKVEKEKKIDETGLKLELRRHIGENLDAYDDSASYYHKYVILSEHAVHQLLCMIYIHLNRLNGMSLSNFLDSRRINLVPRTGFSNERKLLESNPPPQRIPVRMLFKVVARVCFDFELSKKLYSKPASGSLQSYLNELKYCFDKPVYGEGISWERCFIIYKSMNHVFEELCSTVQKERRSIIKNLAKETFVNDSVPKPAELPALPPEDTFPPSETVKSPEESHIPSTTSQELTPQSPEEDDLTVEEMNVSVLFRVVCPGGIISRILALVYKALGGDVEGIKKNKHFLKSQLFKEERAMLNERTIDLSKTDTTFLCKALRSCAPSLSADEGIWSLTSDRKDSMEYHISLIKQKRNELAHQVSVIKTSDLKSTLSTIENSLYVILEKVKIKVSDPPLLKEIEKEKDLMKSEMEKVNKMSDKLCWKNYSTEMNDMRIKVKEAAQEELKRPHLHGESLHCLSPISGSIDPRHKLLTIEAVYMERNLHCRDDVKDEATYRVEDILFSQDSTLAQFRVFIVHGKPGGGRTSICKYIFHLWSKDVKKSCERGVELLFYIPCRYITFKNLSAYLKAKLPQAFQSTHSDDIIPLLQEPNVLFIIDGYDEARDEANGIIDEILTSLPDSKVIITTKTQWLPKLIETVRPVTTRYKVFSMVKMTEEERLQYMNKFFRALKEDSKAYNMFLKYVNQYKEELHAIINVPLTFSLLALVWIEIRGKAEEIKTPQQLYHKLFEMIINRVTDLTKSPLSFVTDWVNKLGEIAYKNLLKNMSCITEHDLIPLGKDGRLLRHDGDESDDQLLSYIMESEFHDTLLSSEKIWTFKFAHQQEYLSAVYLIRKHILSDNGESLHAVLELKHMNECEQYYKKLQKFIPLVEFIFGVAAIYGTVSKGLLESFGKLFSIRKPWAFATTKKVFTQLLEHDREWQDYLKKMYRDVTMYSFDNYDPQITLWILKETSVNVHKEVTLRNTISELPQMKPLLNFLKSHKHLIKVSLDVDKVDDISSLAEFIDEEDYVDIKFVFSIWKPFCISQLIMKWPFVDPLCLSFPTEIFPLAWWEALMCLYTMEKLVTKIEYNASDQKCYELMCDAAKNLKAQVIENYTLQPKEVLIHASGSCSGTDKALNKSIHY